MSWRVEAVTHGPDDTRELAGAVAGLVRPGDLLLLVGGLGAGKTTFAQGFARALGVDGPVTSPTFTLVRQYRCSLGQLLHADLYRLDRLAEVADLGLAELLEQVTPTATTDAFAGAGGAAGGGPLTGAVAVVEWGDVGAPVLGSDAVTVSLGRPDGDGDDDDARTVVVAAGGSTWADRRQRLADALAPWAPTDSATDDSGDGEGAGDDAGDGEGAGDGNADGAGADR